MFTASLRASPPASWRAIASWATARSPPLPRIRALDAPSPSLGRDPRAFPPLLGAARSPPHAVGVARALRLRPLGTADDRGHAALQAVLPRPGAAATSAAHLLPEVLSHDRHRSGWPHRPAPHVLRDAGEFLVRRLLQAGSRRDGLGALYPGF